MQNRSNRYWKNRIIFSLNKNMIGEIDEIPRHHTYIFRRNPQKKTYHRRGIFGLNFYLLSIEYLIFKCNENIINIVCFHEYIGYL